MLDLVHGVINDLLDLLRRDRVVTLLGAELEGEHDDREDDEEPRRERHAALLE